MSIYVRQKFISPIRVYARIKEDFSKYFNTGIIDDTSFSRWTEYCLNVLGMSCYPIREAPISIRDRKGSLPIGFYKPREVFLCTNIHEHVQNPSSLYTQVTSQLTSVLDACEDCIIDTEVVTMKTTSNISWSYKIGRLLLPGNTKDFYDCSNCGNLYSSDLFSYDIHENDIVVNFNEGGVHMLYYAIEFDEEGYQVIPDIIQVESYIEHYIKFKCMETVFNRLTDETFNQVLERMQYYERLQAEKYIIADIEIKRRSIFDIRRSILKDRNRFNHYNKMIGNDR